jgi:hypothetical protein
MNDLYQTLDMLRGVQNRLTAAVSNPARPWQGFAGNNEESNQRGILLYGPRGTGKTTYLLRMAQMVSGVYLSVDHPALATHPLFNWAEALFMRGTRHVYLDEIHHAADWSQSLKALYDSHPDCYIRASGSSSLLLSSGIGDLSRRYVGMYLPYLSFREFLVLKGLPDYGVHDPFKNDLRWAEDILHSSHNILALFESYLRTGLRPLFIEGEEYYGTKIIQVSRKTIESDIPYLIPHLATNHFRLMNAILGYIALSDIPVLQVNSLCREWNVGKEKLYSLLHAMEQTGLLRILRTPSDYTAMSIGSKIFLADPSLYYALSGKEGNMREAFVACALQSAGRDINAARDERKADFIVDRNILIEVGGPKKEKKSADFVVRDGIDWPSPGIIPLWCLGFMW